MALKALFRVFGLGKKEEDNSTKGEGKAPKQVARRHPYDEISDEHLETKRNSSPTPRVHPYDDVADETLQANRNAKAQSQGQGQGQPERRHNYDDVNLERTMSKALKDSASTTAPVTGSSGAAPNLNYVEVDIQPNNRGSDGTRPAHARKPVVYSEVRTSGPTDKVVLKD